MDSVTELYAKCSDCENVEFATLCFKFGLIIPQHHRCSSEPYISFVKTFGVLLNLEDEVIKQLIQEKSMDQAFSALRDLEYGSNISRFGAIEGGVSNLAYVAAIAEQSGKEIVVFCSNLCLNSIHRGNQVIRFKPRSLVVNDTPILCCLTGLNIFHPVSGSQNLIDVSSDPSVRIVQFEIINSLPRANNRSEGSTLSENANGSSNLTRRGNPFVHIRPVEDMRDSNLIENDENGDIPLDPMAVEEANQVLIELSDDANLLTTGDELTLQQFLERFGTMINQSEVSSEIFTSTTKLNLLGSQVSRESLIYNKTYDIDGFFGIFGIEEFGKIVNCSVKFLVYPTLLDKASRRNAQRFFSLDENVTIMFFKIGTIELPIGTIDLIIALESAPAISDYDLKSIVEHCSEYARSLPCGENTNHFRQCNSLSTLDSHRSTRRAITSTLKRNEYENYSLKIAKCYVDHFKCMLDESLQRLGRRGVINIFFKSIGSKAFTFTDNLKECLINLKQFSDAINFDQINMEQVWVDFCITTSAKSPSSPVSHPLFNILS